MASILEEARRLSAMGFNVLPTRRGKKSPAVKWEQWQHQPTAGMVESWWNAHSGFVGIFTMTGEASGLLVLDCDSDEADAFWRTLIGPEMDATACVKTRKGHHYWFSIPGGAVVPGWAYHEGSLSWDVKAEGGGVMTPPSPHPEGGSYEWVRPPESTIEAPSALLNGLAGISGRLAAYSGQEVDTAPVAESIASMLDALRASPPKGQGGRNVWLTKVCGHHAAHIKFYDAYLGYVRQDNALLSPPLDEAELLKTADSIWQAEHAKSTLFEFQLDMADCVEDNGWLIGGNGLLWCPVTVDKVTTLASWCDFDIKVLGIIQSEDAETVDYLVTLTTLHGKLECVLPSKILGRGNELMAWLMARRATIISPKGDLHAKVSFATRLGRYVKAQPAEAWRMVPHLGFDDVSGMWLCHEGVIGAESAQAEPFTGQGVRPSTSLLARNAAPYHYGFSGTRWDAQDVLCEVMTFHDETVCAVFGAWWAASFLKPQIMKRAALFPFMALEAPSGSGKTNGFFALMVQLGGNTEGHGQQTTAVFRDRASAHNAGIVWIDDVSDLDDTLDIIRQATSGGSRSKKSFDNTTNEKVKLVSPIVLSGEGITGLGGEKALSDRAIRLSVPLPNARMSLHGEEGRSQWLDITDLMDQYPGKNGSDLTQLAGWFVSMALECVSDLESEHWNSLRPNGALARFGDSMTILRIGARILEHLMGVKSPGPWVERVDAWVEAEIAKYNPDANVLTNTILPRALLADSGVLRRQAHGDTMVFLDEFGCLNYSESMVCAWWLKHNHITERERQLGELGSMREQRERIIGKTKSTRVRVAKAAGVAQLRYYVLPVDLSSWIVEQAGFDVS